MLHSKYLEIANLFNISMRQYLYRLYFVTSLDNCSYLSTYNFIVLDYTTVAIELKTRAPHCRKETTRGVKRINIWRQQEYTPHLNVKRSSLNAMER